MFVPECKAVAEAGAASDTISNMLFGANEYLTHVKTVKAKHNIRILMGYFIWYKRISQTKFNNQMKQLNNILGNK
jgi:hypothetical protein